MQVPPDAANGLYGRRRFIQGGALAGTALLTASASAREQWMQTPGSGMSANGAPSVHESHLLRNPIGSQRGTTGSGASRTHGLYGVQHIISALLRCR